MTTDSPALGGTYALATFSVHRVGFGAMQLPGPGVMGPPKDHDAAIAVLHRAVELGVNHIDTAQFYGPDVANALIREALHPYADDLAIVSKVGARRDEQGNWNKAMQLDQLREDVEQNLTELGIDQLAAVNLRLPDPRSDDDPPLEARLELMATLRDEGLMAGVGISTATRAEVELAIEIADIVCIQNAYSLLSRDDEDVVDLCRERGVAYVPYFPLGSAFPGQPKVVENATVQDIAQRMDATPAQIGLAWLLAHDPNVLLIPGTSSIDHLEQNLAVASIQLSDSDLAALDAI